MTDKDIIKALECCGVDEDICLDCPIQCDCEKDTEAMIDRAKVILGLINRQKSEIEEHRKIAEKVVVLVQEVKQEYAESIAKARAEAITEFEGNNPRKMR